MYLRTTRRKRTDGSEVVYYQLAHNFRHPDTGRATAQVLHSFGRADELDRDALVRLCRSVARVVDLEVIDPLAEPAAARSSQDPLPEGLEQHRTRELGPVLVAEALWRRLGIDRVVRKLVPDRTDAVDYERALFAMVANRLCEPTSKLGVWDRWLPTVHLPTCWPLGLDQLYTAMDRLDSVSEALEEAVFFETANLLNLQVDLVFYDTTTASFAIDEADEDGLRAFGHSKEGTWTPQVVIALAVTRQGIPVRSWVLPGNTTDVTTIERVKADLRAWKLGRVLLVGDAGMNSEDNRQILAAACGRYVLACRTSNVNEIRDEVLGRAGRYKQVRPNLRVKEVVVGEGERRRRYVVCHNPDQGERERKHREQVVADLEAELAAHRDRSTDRKWVAQLRASGRYGRYLTLDGRGKVKLDRQAVRDAARYDGKWVLITNDDSLSPEDVADAYLGLLVIERGFRTLKSGQLRVRPMHHWLPRRIEAHVKLCVLGLLLTRVAELACEQPWPRILHALRGLQATEYRTATHRFFRTNTVPDEVSALLSKLEIKPPKALLSVAPLD